MKPCGIVSLLTDFGRDDPFVGLMHAVILGRFPQAKIVDLSHGVAPQAVDEAAFWLAKSYRWFPEGTVHVAVVDPGVGTDRAALCIEADGHVFVAPDNGVAGELAARTDALVHSIELERVGLPQPSRTFHGRDVFAPVAAEIAAGRLRVEDVGARAHPLRLEAAPGRVVSVDHFGNLISNLEASELARFERPAVELAGEEIPLADSYAEVPVGELLALVSSFDTLEIAVREGNAAARLGVSRGAAVLVREARPKSR